MTTTIEQSESLPSSLFKASYETQQITDRLKALAAADDYTVVTYAELNALVSGDVQREKRGNLMRARQSAERDTGRLFGVVENVGIKLLAPDEQVGLSVAQRERVRRASRRGRDRIARVQLDRLNADDRKQVLFAGTVLATAAFFTSPRQMKRLNDAIDKAGGPLPVGETLKLFKR